MKYFYKEKEDRRILKGIVYIHKSSNDLFLRSTLYFKDGIGLEVVQKKFDSDKKICYYSFLSKSLANSIKEHPRFKDIFLEMARPSSDGKYPFTDVRKLMWALRMKPMKKEIFEYFF